MDNENMICVGSFTQNAQNIGSAGTVLVLYITGQITGLVGSNSVLDLWLLYFDSSVDLQLSIS